MGEPIPLSVWPTAQQTSRAQRAGRYLQASMAHPAKMLPAIARQAITAYTESGDVVVDPMCGIGTTLLATGRFVASATLSGVMCGAGWFGRFEGGQAGRRTDCAGSDRGPLSS